MRPTKPFFLAIFLLLPLFTFAQAVKTTPEQPLPTPTLTPPYLDTNLPIDQRVHDLVSRMSLEERVAQMQDVAPAIPRLQIPAYNWWNEGLHGVARAGFATVFPQAIALGATWDAPLVHTLADVISTEARAKFNDAFARNNTGRYYGLTFWSPNINIFRDPRWGRGQETYGEDPFLTARLGVAFVTGLQGDDPTYLKTVATPKHYAVHSGPETLRHRFDVPVSLHDFYDTYTPAFRAAVVEGHADSIMCAYNSLREEPACASSLLFNLLRNEWEFHGYVVSDCGAISDLYQGHDYVMSLDQASAMAVKAGTDLSCGTEYASLNYGAENRLVTTSEIDHSVRRLFTARFRLGLFDPPERVPWSKLTLADVDTAANRKLALQAAQESIVLLKNSPRPKSKSGEFTLPLSSTIKSIAVVGPTADTLDVLLGNYNGTPSQYTTILAGIQKRFSNATVTYAPGAPLTETRSLTIPPSAFRASAPSLPSAPVPPQSPSSLGLNAEYFTNNTLTGSPVLTRTEPNVDFLSNNTSPGPGVPVEDYSVRWSGFLIPPVDGDYRIGATSDGGYRLYFDDKLLIDNWVAYRQRGQRSFTTLVHLQGGHPYPIKLEYFRRFRESFARLLWVPPNLLEDAVANARKSDIVIAVVGISPDLEGEERDNSDPGFFGGDRTDIYLPGSQQELLEAVAATGKPLIVVLTNGSALAINWANDHAAAILDSWYSGEEGGTAVASVLAGDYNPAGRLPVTFYKSLAQIPPFTDYSMRNRTYRYFTEQPLYPFGYGLSYSTFSYSAATVSASFVVSQATTPPSDAVVAAASSAAKGRGGPLSPDVAAPGALASEELPQSTTGNLTASAKVTNTSKIPGDEVVELYISHPGVDGAPIRALVGFQRINLDAGATQTVTFTLTPRELSIVDSTGQRIVPAGPAELWIGSSQPIQLPGQPAPNGATLKFNLTASGPLPN
jgi:beta-glucosidase